MPQEVLSPYEPTTLTQNISYGLPAILCNVTVTAACETSTNGSAWIPFNSGTETSAKYIRSAGVGTIVTCKPVMSGVGGESGGGALPTAALGQVLISKGSGVTPVFSNEIILTNNSVTAGNRNWRISIQGDTLEFQPLTDALVPKGVMFSVNAYNSGLSCNGPISVYNYLVLYGGVLGIPEVPFSSANNLTMPGTLQNFSDSTVNTWGSTIVGGGTNKVLGRWNGTVWTVVGK